MTDRPTKRHARKDDLDEDEQLAADAEARLSGERSYRHWRDRNEPPAINSTVAMRQACPFERDDQRRAAFYLGWQEAAGTLWDHAWCGTKFPERKGAPCRVLERDRSMVTVEFKSGERMVVSRLWVRRAAA